MALTITHAKRERFNYDGATYHIISNVNNKEKHISENHEFSKYVDILSETKTKMGFKLHNYSLLNTHSHLLLRLEGENNISKIMHSINRQYARWYNSKHGRTGHFWNNRFYGELIKDDLQLLSTLIYIDLNPVKAGLCDSADKWAFSGARYYCAGVTSELIDPPAIYETLGETPEIRQATYLRIMDAYLANLAHSNQVS